MSSRRQCADDDRTARCGKGVRAIQAHDLYFEREMRRTPSIILSGSDNKEVACWNSLLPAAVGRAARLEQSSSGVSKIDSSNLTRWDTAA
jgi:hypothetical protein